MTIEIEGSRVMVVNAVTHPYDFSPENTCDDPRSWAFVNGMFEHHRLYSPATKAEYLLKREEFLSDFDGEAFIHALFAESPVDVAMLHALPTLGFFHRGMSRLEKVAEIRSRHPQRFVLYGTLNPLDLAEALASLSRQVDEYAIDGLKLYPASYYRGKTVGWAMDDERIAFPVFERLLELGVRNVAVHKAVPLGQTRLEPFRVHDIEGAALEFPELNFQVVHAGLAFAEETAMLIGRFPNVYANLELTSSHVMDRPRLFAEALGTLASHGAPLSKLLFGDGCSVAHSRPIYEAFAAFEMPEDLVAEKGYPILDAAAKVAMLGGTIAGLHGIDLDRRRDEIAGDEFGIGDAVQPPWSVLRGGGGR